MSVALRTITRLQDADDINVSLGAGVDEYALCWDNDTARFVLRTTAGYDHGLLAAGSLGDDDHTQYALLAGRAGGQTLYGGTAANQTITIHGTSDATRTTSYVLLQPTAGNVGIGTSAPAFPLDVQNAGTGTVVVAQMMSAGGGLKLGSYGSGYGGFWSSGFTPDTVNYALLAGTNTAINVPSGGNLQLNVNNSVKACLSTTGGLGIGYATTNPGAGNLAVVNRIGIGTASPATVLHAVSTTATTDAIRNVLTLGANVTSTGVGAAGLGAGLLFQADSTTTADTPQAAIEASWIVATHATRTSRLALKAYDTAEREGIRIDASGAAALLGFYGHAAAAQPSAYTPSNVSADRSFDADTVLVAELADVVGTLIADLQSIGLLA